MLRRAPRRQTVLIGIFLLMVLAFLVLFRMGVVRGESMTPTYADGQVLLVHRRHWFSPPLHRNEVVLLRKDRDIIIKRVYRLESEEIDNSVPYVLNATLIRNLDDYYEQKTEGGQIHYFVPKGYIVVIGDNLRVSEDSRFFGPVPMHDVLGSVAAAPPPPYAGNSTPPPLVPGLPLTSGRQR